MILLSYNYRVLASQPKKLALRDVIRQNNLDILMLQETLGKGEEIIALLSKLLLGWLFRALDANGRSRGWSQGIKQEISRKSLLGGMITL